MSDVVWKPIPSFPNYEASSEGRIRRIGKRNGEPLAICISSSSGYPVYRLARGHQFVSTTGQALVCEAFYGPKPTPLHEAAHGDGARTNCPPDNLSWKTRRENHADKRRHGTHREGRGIPWARLLADDIPDIRAELARGVSVTKIADDYNVSEGAINGIRIGRNWKHIK